MKSIYKDRIIEIDRQIRIAINKKDWTTKAKLEAEKKGLEDKIDKMG